VTTMTPHCRGCRQRRVWHFDTRLCAMCDERSARRQRNAAGARLPPAEHGTLRRYRRGCHCTDCRNANAADKSQWRQRAG